MKLWITIEIEEYKDGSLEVSSEVKADSSKDVELSSPASLFCTCLTAGMQAGVEAFEENLPNHKLIRQPDLFCKIK
jgi:hypothetical protein